MPRHLTKSEDTVAVFVTELVAHMGGRCVVHFYICQLSRPTSFEICLEVSPICFMQQVIEIFQHKNTVTYFCGLWIRLQTGFVHHDLCRFLPQGTLLIQWADISHLGYETTSTFPVRLQIWWACMTRSSSLQLFFS